MKIVAFNGSPRMNNGCTQIVLNKFLEGATSAGAEVETIYLKTLKLNPCLGCYTCWLKTPGRCIQNDNWEMIHEKVLSSNVMVFATPLYNYTVTSYTKILLERLLPIWEPFIVKKKDVCFHPSRYKKYDPVVLLSVCGFPEVSHFDALVKTFQQHFGRLLVGKVLRSASEYMRERQDQLGWFFDAVYRAGVELVQTGKISSETEETISAPIISVEEFVEQSNKRFNEILAQNSAK